MCTIQGYIVFSLEKEGGPLDIFADDTVDLIYKASGGILRIINILCNTALVYGYAESYECINAAVLSLVIRGKEGLGPMENALTLPLVQRLIAAVLPLASMNIKEALEIVRYYTKRNFVAYQCHRKRNLKKAEMLLTNVSL